MSPDSTEQKFHISFRFAGQPYSAIIGLMAYAEQKEQERRIIESARRQSIFFPPGELLRFEKPDWLIPSASIGIEVSELLPQKLPDALFSGPQLSVFQSEVVRTAERCYCALADAQPADVLVYFRNDWTRKRDSGTMAWALAEFVRSNYPSGDTVVLQELSRGVHGWVDGLSVVRITRERGRWQSGGCGDIPLVTHDQLASHIAAKSRRVAEYRRRLPGWDIRLLLATAFPVLWSVSLPREVRCWQFNSAFDRVFLSSWEDGVLELNATNAAPVAASPEQRRV